MARTAPVPNIPAIPGMNPGIFVMGGGGGGGGGSGKGGSGAGGAQSANGDNGGDGAEGGGSGAGSSPPCGASGGCPGNHGAGVTAGDPVDVVTGRMFTNPAIDLRLPGPLPFQLSRSYSSHAKNRDVGVGFGWSHSFAWTVEVTRRNIQVWTSRGELRVFPKIPEGRETLGPEGWVLRHESWGFALDTGDNSWRIFAQTTATRRRFLLSAIDDHHGNRIELTYEDDRLVGILDSAGRRIQVQTTSSGCMTALRVKNAPSGGQWVTFARYEYDARGDLVRVIDADGHGVEYTYDEDHQLTSQRSPTGLTFHFAYRDGRCVETWGAYDDADPSLADDVPALLADGETPAKGVFHAKLAFFDDGYSEVANSLCVQRFFASDDQKLKKAVTAGGIYLRQYDDAGHMTGFIAPNEATTKWTRDDRGRVMSITDPLGRHTMIERDEHGWVREIIDRAGQVTHIQRDAKGRATTVVNPAGGVSAFEYDERGATTAEVAPNGARTEHIYDRYGNCVETRLPNGASHRFTYDGFGNVLTYTTPSGGTLSFTWSTGGKLRAKKDAAGGVTRYAYDGAGNLTEAVVPDGGVYRLTWGGHRMLASLTRPNGATETFRFDREGNLVLVTNGRGATHRIAYDEAGRVVAEHTFDGRKLTFKRDIGGNLIRMEQSSGEVADLTYNLANEVISRSFSDGTEETLVYDAHGDLTQISDGRTTVHYERNALRQVVRETQSIGDDSYVVDVEYDALGRRVTKRTSLGHVEQIERDLMGYRSKVVLDGLEVGQTPNTAGQLIAATLPGGGRIHSTFDDAGRLVGTYARGGVAAPSAGEPGWVTPVGVGDLGFSFTFGLNGELVQTADANGTTDYRHDPIGQILAAVKSAGESESFAYDAAGNLAEVAAPGQTAPQRVYDAGNRLVSHGQTTLRYDADGRLIEKHDAGEGGRSWRYTWDAKGQLATVAVRVVDRPDDRLFVMLAYDPLGRRVSKRRFRIQEDGTKRLVETVLFIWDDDVLIHSITTGEDGNPLQRTFSFDSDGASGFVPLAHKEGDEWFWYLTDPVGAPVALVDARGEVACSLERGVWGRMEARPSARATTPLRFQGQYDDDDIGLFYNRMRYYDPSSGRYISPDALGLNGGFNDYSYGVNPTRMIDPFGLAPTAAEAAQARADELNTLPNSQKPNCVTAVVDTSTGEVYYGTPGNTPANPALDLSTANAPLNTNAAALPPEGIAGHGQPPGNCGEPKAVNEALANGAKLENLEMHTVFVGGGKHGKDKQRCPNCKVTTAGVTTTSDPP